MKIIAFNGSPRPDGNTAFLLKTVLEVIAENGIETEFIQVGNRPMHGCMGCWKCAENQDRQCVIKTDRLNEYLAKMIDSDGFIMGSPSYYSGMTAEMKALIDRSGAVAGVNGKLFSRKIGAAVAVHRRGGAVNVFDSINHMFLMSRMIVPGSTYWNFGVGLDPGDVKADEEALANMRDLGGTISWLVKNLHGRS